MRSKSSPQQRFWATASPRHLSKLALSATGVADNSSSMATAGYQLMFRLYGRDGVMGTLEPRQGASCHELGILIEAVAPTQELANTIWTLSRMMLDKGGQSS